MEIGEMKHISIISSIRDSIWNVVDSHCVTNISKILRNDIDNKLEDTVWDSSYEIWEKIEKTYQDRNGNR